MTILELCEMIREAIEAGSPTIELYPEEAAMALQDAGYDAFPEEPEPWLVLYHSESDSYTYTHKDNVSDHKALSCWESCRFDSEEKAKRICNQMNEMAKQERFQNNRD